MQLIVVKSGLVHIPKTKFLLLIVVSDNVNFIIGQSLGLVLNLDESNVLIPVAEPVVAVF